MDHRVLSFQDAVDIVTHTFRSQRHQKFTRPDEERLLYADLLEWLTLSMNSISKQTQGAKVGCALRS